MNISFIGYVTQEIVVGDRTIINVSLKEDAQNLGEVEVVAIAYGNQDKRMLTSAVSSIDNKKLIKSPGNKYHEPPRRSIAGCIFRTDYRTTR